MNTETTEKTRVGDTLNSLVSNVVFAVMETQYHEGEVKGIYTTLDKAMDATTKLRCPEIREYKLDKADYGWTC